MRRRQSDISRGNCEFRLYAGKRKLKLRLALDVVARDRSITVLPNPRRSGGFTGGPPHSCQLDRKASKPVELVADLHPAAGYR